MHADSTERLRPAGTQRHIEGSLSEGSRCDGVAIVDHLCRLQPFSCYQIPKQMAHIPPPARGARGAAGCE
ncbi:hypothetical protein CSUI_006066 [Cystoisospora suis]|uniref:Uncharacterized protein n=1 Tax=Cystoisospora suis TaxID=483139 RepID=A0A2C6KRL3_9APIC|nr:hypothetical protein CSUI_006066 [Cystoisospora suis]